jgi:hypothetical protein
VLIVFGLYLIVLKILSEKKNFEKKIKQNRKEIRNKKKRESPWKTAEAQLPGLAPPPLLCSLTPWGRMSALPSPSSVRNRAGHGREPIEPDFSALLAKRVSRAPI